MKKDEGTEMTGLKDWCTCLFEPEVEAKIQFGSRCPFCTGLFVPKLEECGHSRQYWYEPPPKPADRYHKDVYQLDPFCLVCHWEMDWDY